MSIATQFPRVKSTSVRRSGSIPAARVARATQECLDARAELAWAERFGQIIVRPIQAHHFFASRAFAVSIRMGFSSSTPQLAADFEPVLTGQHHVKQNQIVDAGPSRWASRDAVAGHFNLVAFHPRSSSRPSAISGSSSTIQNPRHGAPLKFRVPDSRGTPAEASKDAPPRVAPRLTGPPVAAAPWKWCLPPISLSTESPAMGIHDMPTIASPTPDPFTFPVAAETADDLRKSPFARPPRCRPRDHAR